MQSCVNNEIYYFLLQKLSAKGPIPPAIRFRPVIFGMVPSWKDNGFSYTDRGYVSADKNVEMYGLSKHEE